MGTANSALRSGLCTVIAAALAFLALATSPALARIVDGGPDPTWGGANDDLIGQYIDNEIGFETLVRYWNGTPPSHFQLVNYVGARLFYADFIAEEGIAPGRPKIQAAATSSYAFSGSTPVVPFTGNQMVMLGVSGFASNTNLSAVALRRNANCSLTATIFEPVNNRLDYTSVVELPNAQDYFHAMSGLATTGDVFPNGCKDQPYGRRSSNTTLPLGTVNGIAEGVALSNNGVLTVTKSNVTTHAKSTVTLASSPQLLSFAIGDVNGDGFLDVVASGVVNANTGFAIFLNNGDGTFRAPVYTAAAQPPLVFTLDDANDDGKADIVFPNAVPANQVTTLPGVGDGTFGAAVVSSFGSTIGGSTIATGDFNGDGHLDLFVGSGVLLGAGNGSFSQGPALPPALDYELGFAWSATVADFNKDGHDDIAYTTTASNSGVLQVLTGTGNGAFTVGARYAALTPAQQVTATEIDGDGNVDLFVGNAGLGLYVQDSGDALLPMFQVLLGRGDGTFVGAAVPASNVVSAMATADFNGDSKLDALTSRGSNDGALPSALLVLPGDGSGKLGAAVATSVNALPSQLVAADLNQDGKADAVVAGFGLAGTGNAGPLVAVLSGQGNGSFAAEHDYALSSPPRSLAVGDFNGDGRLDVAVGVAPDNGNTGVSGVFVLMGQAGGTLAAPVQIDASAHPASLVAADFNGDGRSDLVVADTGVFSPGSIQQVNGALHLYLGNANGTFTAGTAPATAATNYSAIAAGDLDGDGKADLVVAGNVAGTLIGVGSPRMYALLGTGTGTFGTAHAGTLLGEDGLGAQTIALADFDGDGHLDAIVGNPNDFTEVLLGHGDGTWSQGAVMALAQQPRVLAAADLAGNHKPALLVGGDGGLAVFLNEKTWAAAPALTGTSTALTASPASVSAGGTVTLTATVTGTGGTPTGTVTFLEGATSLGTGTLGASGSATFTTTTLSAGSHSLTARYGGDSTFAASTSTASSVTVAAAAADFAFTASPASATASAGGSATTTVTATPANGFTGTVTLSCSGLPTGATCSFSPASLSVAGPAATSTLTIATRARTARADGPQPHPGHLPLGPDDVLLAGMAAPLLAARRRRHVTSLRRGARQLSWLALVVGAALALHGCGGGGSSDASGGGGGGGGNAGTPAGVYAVTLTASSGSLSHTATFTLTVN